MTALERLAAISAILYEWAKIDSEGTLAGQRFRLDPTSQLPCCADGVALCLYVPAGQPFIQLYAEAVQYHGNHVVLSHGEK
jgi:hypothetical protein